MAQLQRRYQAASVTRSGVSRVGATRLAADGAVRRRNAGPVNSVLGPTALRRKIGDLVCDHRNVGGELKVPELDKLTSRTLGLIAKKFERANEQLREALK